VNTVWPCKLGGSRCGIGYSPTHRARRPEGQVRRTSPMRWTASSETSLHRTDLPATRDSLFLMWLVRRVQIAALIVALATYALDCVGMTTPEQAMQCCNSMRCPSHGHHGQDCCKTMPAMHAAIGQPTAVHSLSCPPVLHGAVQPLPGCESIEASAGLIADHSHDPPSSPSPALLPLRI